MSINTHRQKINTWVTYAPVLFFVMILIGVAIHIAAPLPFIDSVAGLILGIIMLAIAPIIILRAQRARQTLYVPVEDRVCTNYDQGPYRWSRHPAYVGFFMLIIGIAFVMNSLAILILAMVLGPIFTFIIIPQEEALLKKVCDDQYTEYQKRVRMWF